MKWFYTGRVVSIGKVKIWDFNPFTGIDRVLLETDEWIWATVHPTMPEMLAELQPKQVSYTNNELNFPPAV